MHDITTLDRRGLPGVAVISEEFRPGANAQAQALGFQPALVWVPHPIQNRTAAELREIASESVTPILQMISPSGTANV